MLHILYIHVMVVAVHCFEVNYVHVHVGPTLCQVSPLHGNHARLSPLGPPIVNGQT